MDNHFDSVELIWDGLLSKISERILHSYFQLDEESRQEVINHLQRMSTEEGWQPGQRESAQVALNIIQTTNKGKTDL